MTRLTPVPLLLAAGLAAGEHSRLWGAGGEAWRPDGRLPEFGFAGYRCGGQPLPEPPVVADVRDFGAIGDGIADDTGAFNAAIARAPAGAIRVPSGRYRITGFVTIDRPGVVLRGDGPTASVLVFDRPLTDVKPDWGATTTSKRTSNYSWSGGYLVIRGEMRPGPEVAIAAEAPRGGDLLAVAATAGLAAGAWVEVRCEDDAERSLTAWLYGGDPGPTAALKPARTAQPARIAAVGAGTVRLDRPLRVPTRAVWRPRLVPIDPSVTESGIERLGFAFPAAPWHGEFTELGFNAIALADCAHCWVRDVRIHNAEGGIFASGIHGTIDGVVFTADKPIRACKQITLTSSFASV
jgi:hypothetical protein